MQCCFKEFSEIVEGAKFWGFSEIVKSAKFSETVKIPNRQPLLLRKWHIAQKVSVCVCLWHCAWCVSVYIPQLTTVLLVEGWPPWLLSLTTQTLCIWVHLRWRLIRMNIEDVAYLWYLLCCSVAQKMALESLLLQSHLIFFISRFGSSRVTRKPVWPSPPAPVTEVAAGPVKADNLGSDSKEEGWGDTYGQTFPPEGPWLPGSFFLACSQFPPALQGFLSQLRLISLC